MRCPMAVEAPTLRMICGTSNSVGLALSIRPGRYLRDIGAIRRPHLEIPEQNDIRKQLARSVEADTM